MRPEPMSEGERWLAQAERDLSDARFARDGGRHNLACFLSQQAAEKALKGFLYLNDIEAPWSHSARDLVVAAAQFDSAFEGFAKRASDLDKHYIPTRYPNGLPGGIPADAFDESDSSAALDDAATIIGAVAERFPGRDG